jgi:hypothetical protein
MMKSPKHDPAIADIFAPFNTSETYSWISSLFVEKNKPMVLSTD